MAHPPIKNATPTMNFVDQQVQGANVAYYCSLVLHVGALWALGSQLSDVPDLWEVSYHSG